MVKLAARGSYGEAIDIYQDLVGLTLLKTTAWSRTQERGQQVRTVQMQAAEQSWALPKRQEIMPGQALAAISRGVAMDGVLVYIWGEEWKEVKVGCVFEYEPQRRYCPQTQEYKEVVKAKHQSYVAYLGEPEPFGKLLSQEADRQGYDQAQARVSLGDGAKWIWNLNNLCFPTAQEIVDWHHAVAHLWTVAHLAFDNHPWRLRWVKRRKDELWLGQVEQVIEQIEVLAAEMPASTAALLTEAGYFRNNLRRMRYQELREEGYPIGSGTVESACKQLVTTRMKGPGMRWSRGGAENMLALRAEYLSGRWEQAWQLTLAI